MRIYAMKTHSINILTLKIKQTNVAILYMKMRQMQQYLNKIHCLNCEST
jgi:hypothetical protein